MKFRSIALAGAALLALTGPALAGEGWYLGLGAGWSDPQPTAFEITPVPSGKINFDQESWRGIGSLGYRMDAFRFEVEGGYSNPDIDSYNVPGSGALTSTAGHLQEITLMGNVTYDIPVTQRTFLTLGGGAGAGFTGTRFGFAAGTVAGTSTSLAWQAIGGLTYKLTDDLDFQIDYRYVDIGASNNSYFALGSEPYHASNITSHNVMVGFRWYPATVAPQPAYASTPSLPPAPPPPPPPPVAPPPVKVYIVFFDFNKSNLTDKAQEVVAEAVKTAKTNGFVKLMVTGHTDTVGSDKYNQALSERRAAAVKDEMVREGMDGSTIAIEGKSFHDPLVATGPGVREPQNRRAVIDLGG